MPKIILKPGSPEYADKEDARSHVQMCEMPGCPSRPEHKAPKHRALDEYYHFCLDHVREYNKAWNFFSGMSGQEVEDHVMKSYYGDRPTWRYGVEGEDMEEKLYNTAWKAYHHTDKDPDKGAQNNGYRQPMPDKHSAEFEALCVMGLTPPVTLDTIKTEYKKLAKKHHPDLNGGCAKSEELLKRINMAYTILKLAYSEFEKLPERPSS